VRARQKVKEHNAFYLERILAHLLVLGLPVVELPDLAPFVEPATS
jgi:hypothetical protein